MSKLGEFLYKDSIPRDLSIAYIIYALEEEEKIFIIF
jgi:hypothetical protein